MMSFRTSLVCKHALSGQTSAALRRHTCTIHLPMVNDKTRLLPFLRVFMEKVA